MLYAEERWEPYLPTMQVCLITNPIWVVKTRLQLQRGAGAAAKRAHSLPTQATNGTAPVQYKGFVDAIRRIAQEEGLRGLYKGLGPSLVMVRKQSLLSPRPRSSLQAPERKFRLTGKLTRAVWCPQQVSHGAIQFMVYEELKRLVARGPESQARTLTSLEITLIGAASKLFATLSTYPLAVRQSTGSAFSSRTSSVHARSDTVLAELHRSLIVEAHAGACLLQVIRSRLQQRQQAGRLVLYKDGWTALRSTLRREGVGGLYKGVVPNVLRVLPSSALTLLIYEKLMQQMLKLEFGEADDWQQQ